MWEMLELPLARRQVLQVRPEAWGAEIEHWSYHL